MQRSGYWQILPYIRPQWRTILQAFVCTLVFTAGWPLLIRIVQELGKSVGAGDVQTIIRVSGIAALVLLIRGIAHFGQDSLMAKAALKITLDIRTRVYAHLQTLSLNYFETTRTGDLTYRLTEDVDRIGEVVYKAFHDFTPCILQLIVVIGYMIYLNWQLTIAVLILAPLMGVLIGAFGERLLKFSRKSQQQISNLSSILTEVFGGIRLVQAFAAEEHELNRFRQEADQNRRAKYLAERLKALQYGVVGFLEAMCVVFLFFLGGWQISKGNLTGVQFIGYIVAVAMLIDPIGHLTSNYNEFKQGQASFDRIFELFKLEPLILEKPNAKNLPLVDGKVEFIQVSFAYQSDQPILKNINLTVYPGEMIALVGASGAGKTSLVNLIPRFYDPQQGEILIDGVDISQVNLKSLRQQIGIVPQDTLLFSGTIAENIAFGQSEFDIEDVRNAAQIANADQFISQFAQGYYTHLGERGVNLSGGQKQRIAIARAIYLNPRILILDEATSALDSESESLVQEALERIMHNRTVFVIAHRLATVRKADRILVLDKGNIIESGTHAELLSHGGRYSQFHTQQFRR